MDYFLIAGEASGDLHGSHLITALKREDPHATFRFLGGDMMAAAAGRAPLIHYRNMAFMGFIEVAKHLRSIMGFLGLVKDELRRQPPGVVILIDYPSFNLKVAKWVHNTLHVPVHYFISPKVWAWKQWRVKAIKRVVDRVFSILPFEVDFYRRHGYEVDYVGNPTVNEVDAALAAMGTRDDWCRASGLDPGKPIIALVPGSRVKEIRDNLPTMLQAARRHPAHHAVVAAAPGVDDCIYQEVLAGEEVPVLRGCTFELVRHARAALVTSGTATLETALLGTPQVACYRVNGSKWLYRFYSLLIKGKYVTLPNLIVDAPVIPELLLHHCSVDGVERCLAPLLEESPQRAAMLEGYARLERLLGHDDCCGECARRIVRALASPAS